MKKRTIILISIAVVLVASVILFIIKLPSIKRSIKDKAISMINEQISVPVHVGDISVSFFKYFPNVSVSFNDVSCRGSNPSETQPDLLAVKNIDIEFNFIKVIKKNFEVNTINISDGKINILEFDNNENNFDISVKTGSSEDSSRKTLIKNLKINDIELYYKKSNKFELACFINELKIQKKSSVLGTYGYKIKTDITPSEIYFNNQLNKFSNHNIKLKSDVDLNTDNKTIAFDNCNVKINKVSADIDGSFCYNKGAENAELTYKTDKINLAYLVEIIPENYLEKVRNYKFGGEIKSDGKIKYANNSVSNYINVKAYNISAKSVPNDLNINSLSFDAQYINSNAEKNKIELKNLKGKYNEINFEGDFNLNHKGQDIYNANIISNFTADKVNSIAKLNDIDFIKGGVSLNAHIEGDFNDIINKHFDIDSTHFSGTISLQDVELKPKVMGKPFKNIVSEFAIVNNNLYCNHLNFIVGKSDVSFSGVFENAVKTILIDEEVALLKGNIISNQLDAADFKIETSDSTKSGKFALPHIFSDIEIKKFIYEKLNISDFSGTFIYNSDYSEFRNLKANTLSGSVDGNLKLKFNNDQPELVQTEFTFNNIDIHELFVATDNFGFNDLKANNIYGKLSGNLTLLSPFKDNKIDLSQLKMHSVFTINDGRLLKLELAEKLSKFIRIDELNDMKFASLTNEISIKDGVLSLPNMLIRSNALDFSLMGNHSITDKNFSYHCTLLLSDVLWSKWKKKNPDKYLESEKEEEFGKGKSKLFVVIAGDGNGVSIKYDREVSRQKFKKDVEEQKIDLKQALNREFNWFKNDTTLKKDVNKTQSTEEKTFTIEWEDE
ncbi:MAG: AsmA-like C-terminal region-containing protein [Lentimicrobiaceae bacterium]|nr:AsmA-like C-terminal region-containing protein [Lentimicrobiaceae bacterium]